MFLLTKRKFKLNYATIIHGILDFDFSLNYKFKIQFNTIKHFKYEKKTNKLFNTFKHHYIIIS